MGWGPLGPLFPGVLMESMKKYKTFDEWKAKHIRVGDGEKFRKDWDAIHGESKPRRRGRPKKEESEQESTDE